MTEDRIKELAEAYGADPRRWPDAERAAAKAFLDENRARADRLLFDARQIDFALDTAPRPLVSEALRAKVLAAAEDGRKRPSGVFGWLRRPGGKLVWASGFGWAAAACAGVVFGLATNHQTDTVRQADAVLYQASLVGLDDEEVLG